MFDWVRKCTPSVRRQWRVLLGGLLWLAVGIGLVMVACFWLSEADWPLSAVLAAFALAMGFLIYAFGFSRIARRNIRRIEDQPEKVCLFAFQGWQSHFLVLFMMALGYAVRHMPIPRYIDAVIYMAIGSALAFSSSVSFQEFFRS